MILKNYSKLISSFLSLFATTSIIAQTTAIEHQLDSIVVVAQSHTSPLKGLGSESIHWDTQSFQSLPQILSSANPLLYVQMLPAVQTNANFDAGLHIYGCENMHNRYSIEGISVFNPSHLLGLFSTFSAEHFKELVLTKSATSALFPNIIGGQVDMISPKQNDSLRLTIDAGLIFSEVNLRIPIRSKSALNISSRISYLNWLYNPLLKVDDSQINYGLSDYNLDWLWHVSSCDTFSITAYCGQDNLKYEDTGNSRLDWSNNLIGAKWIHRSPHYYLQAQLYSTNYRNKLFLYEGAFQLECPASISDIGLTCKLSNKYHFFEFNHIVHITNLDFDRKIAIETSLASNWSKNFDFGLYISAGARFINYRTFDQNVYNKTVIDPVINLKYYSNRTGQWSITYNTKHQFLQQTSISQLGLPIEFFFLSSNNQQPQYAHSFIFSHDVRLKRNEWHLCIETFYKKLSHQKEYTGNGLSLLAEQVNQYTENITDGAGTNYGIDFILSKRSGRLSGWISLTLIRALRKFSCFDYTFPASHERRYDLNVLATYKLTSRLSISGTYILADGNPFTAPKSFFSLDGRIISSYDRYNANRLPPYQRLDLALKWTIPSRTKIKQTLNFSLYNVCYNKNISFYRLKFNNNQFGYKPMSFMPYILPSLSYTIQY